MFNDKNSDYIGYFSILARSQDNPYEEEEYFEEVKLSQSSLETILRINYTKASPFLLTQEEKAALGFYFIGNSLLMNYQPDLSSGMVEIALERLVETKDNFEISQKIPKELGVDAHSVFIGTDLLYFLREEDIGEELKIYELLKENRFPDINSRYI